MVLSYLPKEKKQVKLFKWLKKLSFRPWTFLKSRFWNLRKDRYLLLLLKCFHISSTQGINFGVGGIKGRDLPEDTCAPTWAHFLSDTERYLLCVWKWVFLFCLDTPFKSLETPNVNVCLPARRWGTNWKVLPSFQKSGMSLPHLREDWLPAPYHWCTVDKYWILYYYAHSTHQHQDEPPPAYPTVVLPSITDSTSTTSPNHCAAALYESSLACSQHWACSCRMLFTHLGYQINASPETGPNHHPVTLHMSIVV